MEQEAHEDKFEIVTPSVSVLAELPVAEVDKVVDKKVAAQYAKQFANVKLFTVDEVFGGWQKAQKTHFADGGIFDQISVK